MTFSFNYAFYSYFRKHPRKDYLSASAYSQIARSESQSLTQTSSWLATSQTSYSALNSTLTDS